MTDSRLCKDCNAYMKGKRNGYCRRYDFEILAEDTCETWDAKKERKAKELGISESDTQTGFRRIR